METGVMKKDKIWTGNDEVKVFQNNPAQDENKQTLVAGLGTAIFCKKEITLMKGQQQFNTEKMALAHIRTKKGNTNSIVIGAIQTRNFNNKKKWEDFNALIDAIET